MRFAVLAAILTVFALDLFMPAGMAVAVPYVVIVLLAFWLPERRAILKTAALITVLAIIGLYFPLGAVTGSALHNRSVTLGVIWLTAILGDLIVGAQESTRRERDFNESLIETAPTIIVLLDVEGRIERCNRQLAAVTGYASDEVQRLDWIQTFVPAEQRTAASELLHRCHCRPDESSGSFELPLLTRDGTVRQFSWSCKAMCDAGGENVRLLLVGQEITALLQAQQRAVAAERLAAIGQTISVVSHESRNELQMLQIGLDVLRHSTLDAQAEEAAEYMRASLARLQRHFDDLRHFAGPVRLELSEHSLRDIWRDAWSTLESLWRERDAVFDDDDPADADVRCRVDALRIEQVFRNLFENSLAACADPMRIEIRCSPLHQDGRPYLQVSVRDNGPGLSPEAGANVFEAFYTTKSQGGTLTLADNADCGAEFHLQLPLHVPTTAPAPPATQNSAAASVAS